MNSADLDRLRKNADRKAEAFSRSLAETSRRMRPARLIDDAVHALDPEFRALRRFEAAVQRHPIAALAALAGLAWVVTETFRDGARRERFFGEHPDFQHVIPDNHEGELNHGNEHDDARQRYGDEDFLDEQDEESRWRQQAGRQ